MPDTRPDIAHQLNSPLRCRQASLHIGQCDIGDRGIERLHQGRKFSPHRSASGERVGLDQGTCLVACAARLRFSVGQRNPIGLRINLEEQVVLLDRRVRSYCDTDDLARNLRADRCAHGLNIGIFLTHIAAGHQIESKRAAHQQDQAKDQQRRPQRFRRAAGTPPPPALSEPQTSCAG